MTGEMLCIGALGFAVVAGVCVIAVDAVENHEDKKLERKLKEEKHIHDKEIQDKEIEIKNKEALDKEKYYSSMTSEDKAKIEIEKEKTEQKRLEAKIKESEARALEAETKKTVEKFKGEIEDKVRSEMKEYVKRDSKDIFNTWVTTYQANIDSRIRKLADDDDLDSLKRKVLRLEDKIDDLVNDDDLDSLKRDISRLEDRIDDIKDSIPSAASPSSSSTPNITVAPVISH